MVDFEVTFCDKQPPEERKEILGIVFSKDIFLPNGFMDKNLVKGNVLDLGCGRGAIGALLEDINKGIKLTGIDVVTTYEGDNFWNQYSVIRNNDASVEVAEIKKTDKQKFDLVISYGMPPKAIENLVEKDDVKDIVKSGGAVLFVFDAPIRYSSILKAQEAGFKSYQGTFPTDPHILFWQNE